MKNSSKFICLLLILLLVSSCGIKLSGSYKGKSSDGIPVSMEFDNGNVQTNLFGVPISGSYKLKGRELRVTLSILGQSQEIVGEVYGDELVFDGITLIKQD